MAADSAPASSETPETLIAQGLRARANGDHAGALARFEAAVAADLGHVAAQCEMACELYKLLRFDEAEAMFSRLLAQAPQTIRAMVELGYLLRDRARPDEAEAMLRQAVALAPGNARALLGLGHLARQRGERAAALDAFERALAAAGSDRTLSAAAQLQIATQLTEQGQFDEARRRIAAALETNPVNRWAWRSLGLLERRRGDRQASLDAFKRALALAPADASSNAAIRMEIATELSEQGQVDEARRIIAGVLETNPANDWARRSLGLLTKHRGSSQAAGDALGRKPASTAPPDASHVAEQIEIATALREQRKFDEARRRIATVLETNPANAAALIALGQIERRAGDRQAALDAFGRAVACAAGSEPMNAVAQLEIATELRDQGQIDEARRRIVAVLEMNPSNASAWIGLGQTERRAGNRPAALDAFGHALAMASDKSSKTAAQLQIAIELVEQRQFDEARRRLVDVVEANPANGAAWINLGQLERRAGDRKAALHAFSQAQASTAATDPLNAAARIEIATELREQRKFDEARHQIAVVLEANRANASAWIGLGQIERRAGDRQAALDAFRRAAASAAGLEPWNAAAQLEIATEFRDQGQCDEARRRIATVLDANPANASAWMNLGQTERRAGDRHAAIAAFRQAAEREPQRAQALVEIAVEQRALGQPGESERTLQHALEIEPDHLGTLMQMAEHAWIADNNTDSLAICQRAIAAHPAALAPYLSASRAAIGLGNVDEALALLDGAAEIVGPQPEIAARTIEILRQAGERAAARAVLDDNAADVPTYFPLWAQSVQLDLSSGAYDDAAAALRDPPAATIDQQARVSVFRGELAETEWRVDEAIGHYHAALARDPSLVRAHAELSRLYLLRCDADAAATHLAASVRLGATGKLLRGESLNVSQNFIGQVLNEFVLDRVTLDALQHLQARAPGERVVPLQELVRLNADHTPSAMCLLIAMRQSGLLARPAPDAGDAEPAVGDAIPRQIVQYWDAAAPPQHIMAMMQSWSETNPDYRHARFDDKAARDFIAAHYPSDVLSAYMRARHPAQKSDIFRLAYLASEGGIYADADDRCLAPLGSIVPPQAELVLYQENFGTIGNNFIAVRPRHPVIASALDGAVAAMNRGDNDIVWLSTGPGLLSRVFARLLCVHQQPPVWVKQAVVLERGALLRAVAIHCQLHYKRTNQHWSRGAFRNNSRSTSR